MAKNITWDYLKKYSSVIPMININESELRIDYPGGGRFQLFGADNPDSLRGLKFDFVIFDEYSQQPSNIFTEVIRPTLVDSQGSVVWIGTPKGKNEFYRLYEEADRDNWYRVLLRASETGVIPEHELEDAKYGMSSDEFNQEFECSWIPSIRGSYYADDINRARQEGRISNVPYNAELPVYTVWDLGVADDTAIGFYQIAGREPHMVDYYHNSGKGLDHYVKYITETGYHFGGHYAPHDIRVRELSTGKSRKDIAANLGIDFDITPNLPIKDGIEAGRRELKRMWIDVKRCDKFLDALLQYRREWDESKGCFRDKPLHDWTSHAADVHRYFSLVVDKMTNERTVARQYKPNINFGF